MTQTARPPAEPRPLVAAATRWIGWARGHARRDVALGAIAVLIAARVWLPLVRNYFRNDDFLHLYNIVEHGFWKFVFTPFGGHLLVVRNFLFYVTFKAFGPWPEAFFTGVLVTHLANVALLFVAIRLAGASAWVACFGATLWGIAPVLEGSLGWYSVYGQVVGTTLCLLPLIDAFRLAQARQALSPARAAAWALLLWGAANSFGTALGYALAFPLAVPLLLDRPLRGRVAWAMVAGVIPLVVLQYLLTLRVMYGSGEHPWLGVSLVLGFASYVRPQLEMLAHLVGYGIASLVLGDGLARDAYPSTAATAGVVAAAALVAIPLVVGPRADRRRILAVLGLALAAYAMIAIGRGSYTASFYRSLTIPARALRYHYLAPCLLALALCTALGAITRRADRTPGWLPPTLLATWLVLVGALWRGRAPIAHHDADRQEVRNALLTIRLGAAEYPPGAPATIWNRVFPPTLLMGRAFPGWAGLFIIYFPEDEIDGRPIRFAIPYADVVQERESGTRPRLAKIGIPMEPLLEAYYLESFGPICPAPADPNFPRGDACWLELPPTAPVVRDEQPARVPGSEPSPTPASEIGPAGAAASPAEQPTPKGLEDEADDMGARFHGNRPEEEIGT